MSRAQRILDSLESITVEQKKDKEDKDKDTEKENDKAKRDFLKDNSQRKDKQDLYKKKKNSPELEVEEESFQDDIVNTDPHASNPKRQEMSEFYREMGFNKGE